MKFMWDPDVSVGGVKTKIHPHSWLLLSLDLPSAPDICLGLCGTSTQCNVLPQKDHQALLNTSVKQRCLFRCCGQPYWCFSEGL